MRNLPWGLLAVFLITSAFFIPHWLAGNLFGTFDLSHITAPIEDIFARYQAAGEIPIWAREFQAGFPLMANGFQSFFYPPHLLLRIWLPGIWLTNISLLLHLWLATAGMWLLLRQHKFSSPVATLGVLVFAGGGYFIGRVTLPHLFFPATWIPLILWALFRLWRQPNIANAALFAVTYAAQIFSGHIQMAIYAGMMIGIAAVALAVSPLPKREREGTPPAGGGVRGGGRGEGIKRLFLLFLAALAVWLLAAVHILPTQQLLPLSRRAAPTTQEEAFDVSYPPRHLLTWLKPDYFGRGLTYHGAKNEPELMMYFGVSGLLLGLTGIMNKKTWREPLGRASLGLIIVGLVLAGGEYSLIFRWLHSLPTPLAQLANPGRAIIFIHVGWCMLASYGASWLLKRKIFSPKSLYILAGVAALELFVAGWPANPVVPASAWAKPPQVLQDLPTRPDAPRIFSHAHLLAAPDADFAPDIGPKITQTVPIRQTVVAQRDGWQAVGVQLTWNGHAPQPGKIHLRILDQQDNILRESFHGAEQIRDDELTYFSFSPLSRSQSQPLVVELRSDYPDKTAPRVIMATNLNGDDLNPTGALQGISGGDGQSLDLVFDLIYDSEPVILDRQLLLPIFGESYGQQMLRGHLTLQLLRVYKYMYELGERGDFITEHLADHRDMLDRLSAGTILSSYPEHRGITGMPNLTLVAKLPAGERDVHVYRNDQAYPLVSFAKQVIPARNADEARQLLVHDTVPKDSVVVENFSSPANLAADFSASFDLAARTASQTIVKVNSDSPQFLVIRDALFPGWQATIDNQPTQLYYVDSLFQGVLVPAGEHEVVLEYHSKPFIIGAWLSGVSWIIAGITIGLWYNFKDGKRSTV